MSKPIQIDVEAILASKAGDKARFVPRFLISYLKKIIHQDEVNGFLELHGDKMDYDFVDAFIGKDAEGANGVDTVAGATLTTQGYKSAIKTAFEALELLKGGNA